MASGRTHSTVTIAAATAIAGTAVAAEASGRGQLFPMWVAVPMAIGCFSGVFLSPDLDSNGHTNQHTQVRRFLGVAGELAALIWYFIWRPYALHFKHRSKASHYPLLSTAIRVGYLNLVTLGLFGFVPGVLWYSWQARSWEWPLYLGLWLFGLAISDWLHFVFDWI